MWTCIALSCSDASWAQALRKELIVLQKQGILKSTLLLVIEDPEGTVGGGGATLNALQVITERLSIAKGFSTITYDVFWDSNILILHYGRQSCYWPSSKAFFASWSARPDKSGLQCYLEYVADLCYQLRGADAPAGTWIVSADTILSGKLQNNPAWSSYSLNDSLLFTVSCKVEEAEYCGIVKVNEDSAVHNISFGCPKDDEEVDIVGGIIFLQRTLVESLVSLNAQPPIDCCTYLGADNGEHSLLVSLYFDLLGPLCSGFEKELYLAGSYGNRYEHISCQFNNTSSKLTKARKLLWEQLRGFKLRAFPLTGIHHLYWTDQLPLEQIFLKSQHFSYYNHGPNVLHSSVSTSKETLICVNSLIETDLDLRNEKELVVISSQILTDDPKLQLNLSGRAYIINAQIRVDQIPEFHLRHNSCVIGYNIHIDQQPKLGIVLFSATDLPLLERSHPDATFFGSDWPSYLTVKGIKEEDLWAKDSRHQTLMNARLFPLAEDVTDWRNLLWLQDFSNNTLAPSRLESWRGSKRYSMEDFLGMVDPQNAFSNLRSTAAAALMQAIRQWPWSLLPYFHRSYFEGWTDSLLLVLDKYAVSSKNNSEVARFLTAIADLLGCAAGFDNGVRISGPASNKEWTPSLHLLEHVSLNEGILSLSRLRSKWMDTPERLMRVTRHYERAVQILIRKAVSATKTWPLNIRASQRPAIGSWIEVECPARLDLAGGWSDTPPISYEKGGSVVNISILVDGKKPIGVRARRIEELEIVLGFMENKAERLVITSLEQLFDYTNPVSLGALLKVALVSAGIVQQRSHLDLQQQLQKTLGSGLELHSWSLLPHGSGLGTSSILAAGLLAAIYTAMGVSFDKSRLIHDVLGVEQLLSTGGGWQDQVGGIMGGANHGYSLPEVKVQVGVEKIPLAREIVAELNEKILLVYTGKVRLARNLLQNVIRNWYSKEETTIICFDQLVENARNCAVSLRQGDLEEVGRCISKYSAQKDVIARGSIPIIVGKLMSRLDSLAYGLSMVGAGGGGFFFSILKEKVDRSAIQSILDSIEGTEKFTIHTGLVDETGMTVLVDGNYVEIPYVSDIP